MNNKFDELTKRLAHSTTRRQALKKFGAGRAGFASEASASQHESCWINHCIKSRGFA